MRTNIWFLIVCVSCIMTAANTYAENSDSQRLEDLRKQLTEKDATLEKLREQNLVLRELSDKVPAETRPGKLKSHTGVPTLKLNQQTGVIAYEDEGDVKAPEGERIAYGNVLQNYQTGKLSETIRYKNILLKYFPKSSYADNAIYLVGMLHFEKGFYAEAIRSFDQLIKFYPRGNKRASALYGKASAYQKLKLKKPSESVLKQILEQYPGSQESHRAVVDLELLGAKG